MSVRRKAGPVDVEIGALVRARREAAGMTQPDLAAAIRVAPQQLSKYEQGDHRIAAATLAAIARALGCAPADLFPPITSEEAA